MMRAIDLFGQPKIDEFIPPAIPYQGNKRKLASRILNTIYDNIGDFNTFYDLFGGGASMSMASFIAGHDVVYNELNTGVVNLLKYIIEGNKIPMNWVSREEFHKHVKLDTWYAGLIKTCWSFGNDQQSYLFGSDIEEPKRLMHEIIINQGDDAKEKLSKLLNLDVPSTKDRFTMIKFIMKNMGNNKRLEQLERLKQLQQLTQLEKLKKLQTLIQLKQIKIYNKSYIDVDIENNSVLYCDIPYKNTKEYQHKKFNYDEFYNWALSNNNPVFVSEYSMPNEFKCVGEFEHLSTMAANTTKKVTEKLFWNKKEVVKCKG